jgi:hypothetical protein
MKNLLAPSSLASCLLLFAGGLSTHAREAESAAAAATRQAFAAMQHGRLDEFVGHLHPQDLPPFAKLVRTIAAAAASSKDADAKALARQLGRPEDLNRMTPEDVTRAFLQAVAKQTPDYEALLAGAKLRLLGEVAEGEGRSVMVYRWVLPRPQAVLVEKYEGRWRLRLDPAHREMAEAVRLALTEDRQARLQKLIAREVGPVRVLGTVREGEDLTHVVIRTAVGSGQDKWEKTGVFPIPKGDDAWGLLGGDQRPQLEAALRKRLEATWQTQKQLLELQLELLNKAPGKDGGPGRPNREGRQDQEREPAELHGPPPGGDRGQLSPDSWGRRDPVTGPQADRGRRPFPRAAPFVN